METDKTAGVYSQTCPTRELLDRIADKWTTLIIGILSETDAVRFTELRRTISGISQKMLTQTLRDLERDGLVVRKVYAVVPPRVEYSLSPLGRTLCAPLNALAAWSEEHMAAVKKAQERYDIKRASAATGNSAA
jgi:DNA-binding HxlR family transcriptional regulator